MVKCTSIRKFSNLLLDDLRDAKMMVLALKFFGLRAGYKISSLGCILLQHCSEVICDLFLQALSTLPYLDLIFLLSAVQQFKKICFCSPFTNSAIFTVQVKIQGTTLNQQNQTNQLDKQIHFYRNLCFEMKPLLRRKRESLFTHNYANLVSTVI